MRLYMKQKIQQLLNTFKLRQCFVLTLLVLLITYETPVTVEVYVLDKGFVTEYSSQKWSRSLWKNDMFRMLYLS